ncbi:MAG: 30S ribosomal protein S12 methylthiotransferase RimO [Treponema sp.]|nr:30S ribosomal protein S12 methylthiotransferase RimO [Treponema sp.]
MDQHGCAKNQTDGELIVGFLINEGFQQTFEASEADFIIVNSCGFIESAKKESIDAIYNINVSYPEAKIILTGCLAQRYAEMLGESMPELSGIFGNGDLSKISEFMKNIQAGKRLVETYPQEGVCAGNRPVLFNYKGSAFVKITEGCSNHCSFCAIPLIRGEVRSRPAESIIAEIKELIAAGVYEINLIGQDLAAYGTGVTDNAFGDGRTEYHGNKESGLCRLLKMISALEGDFLIRMLYIHPDHFNTDILAVMKADNRFAKYFDIPFQSGDDGIIKAMNRTGTGEIYAKLIADIRNTLGECTIRTTFLTGFPGESDEAAGNTLKFQQTIKPDWSGCFPYSREEDTPAYDMKKRVSKKVAEKRAADLENAQSEITAEKLNSYIGRKVDVLVEEIIELDEQVAEDSSEGLAIGRSWFQAPEVDGAVVIRYERDLEQEAKAVQPGNVVTVEIIASAGVDLDARFISLKKEFKSSKLEFRNI